MLKSPGDPPASICAAVCGSVIRDLKSLPHHVEITIKRLEIKFSIYFFGVGHDRERREEERHSLATTTIK
jgi:hypothetical protein